MNFALVTDINYLKPTIVTIISILENSKNPQEITFYIFCVGFFKRIRWFHKIQVNYKCKIVLIDTAKYEYLFSTQDQTTFVNNYISKTTYFRLLIFKVLDESVDKIAYVDSDIIIQDDLENIFLQINNEKFFSAVAELNDFTRKYIDHAHLKYINDFKLWDKNNYLAPYFNAGFFVTSLKKCREFKIFELIMDFLRRYPNPLLADQDALNAIFGQKLNKHINVLNYEYNVCCDLDFYDYLFTNEDYFYAKDKLLFALKNPKIIHYDGPCKPWKSKAKTNFYDNWWYYANKSGLKFKRRNQNFLTCFLKQKILGHNL